MTLRNNRGWLLPGALILALIAVPAWLTVNDARDAHAEARPDEGPAAPSNGGEQVPSFGDLIVEAVEPSGEALSLQSPGPMRPGIQRGGRSPEPLGEPLASRMESSLDAALAGDGRLAGELARGLRNCREFERGVMQREADVLAARAGGFTESSIRAREELLLDLVERSPLPRFCAGISEADFALIEQLSEIAVENGNFGELGEFLAARVTNEHLRRYLADPVERDAFRSTAMAALERGVRNCHETTARTLARFHAEGAFARQDPVLALSFELVATWIGGIPPERAVQLQARLEGLKPAQIAAAVRYARRVYDAGRAGRSSGRSAPPCRQRAAQAAWDAALRFRSPKPKG